MSGSLPIFRMTKLMKRSNLKNESSLEKKLQKYSDFSYFDLLYL